MTQEQFAEAFGVSRATVINWETGKTSIPPRATERLAEFFGVTVAEFRDHDQVMIDHLLSHGQIKLTPEEEQNIAMFRTLPEEVKVGFRHAIYALYTLHKEGNDGGT